VRQYLNSTSGRVRWQVSAGRDERRVASPT
jgi:hypothetical protein